MSSHESKMLKRDRLISSVMAVALVAAAAYDAFTHDETGVVIEMTVACLFSFLAGYYHSDLINLEDHNKNLE